MIRRIDNLVAEALRGLDERDELTRGGGAVNVDKKAVMAMQKVLQDLPDHQRDDYVRDRIADGSLPGTQKAISLKAMLGGCTLLRRNDLMRVYYEVLLKDMGDDVVAAQVSMRLEAEVFVRIFGPQAANRLPDELRNAVKRKTVEQDFGL